MWRVLPRDQSVMRTVLSWLSRGRQGQMKPLPFGSRGRFQGPPAARPCCIYGPSRSSWWAASCKDGRLESTKVRPSAHRPTVDVAILNSRKRKKNPLKGKKKMVNAWKCHQASAPPAGRPWMPPFSLSSQNVPVDDRSLLHQRKPHHHHPLAFMTPAPPPRLIIILASPLRLASQISLLRPHQLLQEPGPFQLESLRGF